jgi:hypothetical protein
MEFLVVVKSLKVMDEEFQAIARPPEDLTASTTMELLFFRIPESIVWIFSLFLFVS